MPWIQIRVGCDEAKVKKVSSMLQGAGAQAVTYMDAQDNPIYEPPLGTTKLWANTVVIGLFEADVDPFRIVHFIEKNLGSQVQCKVEQLEDKDWVREWMEHFHPMQFGKKLWICPSWCEIPDKNAVNVMLDPGLAFGTGTHPTTAMCLEYLDGFEIKGRTVIDYGCGSGILAIAALKLGAGKVIGIDIDPQAIQASRDNAVRNAVSENFELYLVDERPAELQADLVVANILAGPLRELAPLLSTLVKDHGHIALSGILETQAQEINGIYGQWFDMTAPNIREEWCQLSGIKK
ncbi:MAG: 50S ribosomal protein L11 methyltransferase [Succinivibrionaceae bacterium]|nr:50S ribosomal protein L11 methyltransferase [Succinivibrionaceae bacterium]